MLVAWSKASKRKNMFFKIDFEKAYNMVSWDFLDFILRQMAFSELRRFSITNGLRSSRASVVVNGSPKMEFNMSRGLRQRDPVSLFLLTIVMEALGCALK